MIDTTQLPAISDEEIERFMVLLGAFLRDAPEIGIVDPPTDIADHDWAWRAHAARTAYPDPHAYILETFGAFLIDVPEK